MASSSTNNNDERERQIEKLNEGLKALEEALEKHKAQLGSEDERGKQEKKLNEDIKALKEVIEKQEARLSQLQSNGFQLANYYFVFQGVILTTLCNGKTALKCSDRWFLTTLSALAAAVNLAALISIGFKYNRIFKEQEQTRSNCNKLLQKKQMLQLQQQIASGDVLEIKDEDEDIPVDKYEILKRRVYFGICMTFFLSFAIIVFVGNLTFLCRDTEGHKK